MYILFFIVTKILLVLSRKWDLYIFQWLAIIVLAVDSAGFREDNFARRQQQLIMRHSFPVLLHTKHNFFFFWRQSGFVTSCKVHFLICTLFYVVHIPTLVISRFKNGLILVDFCNVSRQKDSCRFLYVNSCRAQISSFFFRSQLSLKKKV